MRNTWADVGEAVTERRLELDLTQQQAAALSGLSATTWQKLEVRHEKPNDRSLRRMAKALNWAPDFAETILAGRTPGPALDQPTLGLDGRDLSATELADAINTLQTELDRLRAMVENGRFHFDNEPEGDQP